MKLFFAAVALAAAASTAHAQPIETGTFDMYSVPNANPHPGCDVHAELTLDNGQITGPFAVLESTLTGNCEIYVSPNPRFFRLTYAGTSCGSKQWEGTIETRGERQEARLTDHRTRICDDIVPARIILSLTDSMSGEVTKLYSKDH